MMEQPSVKNLESKETSWGRKELFGYEMKVFKEEILPLADDSEKKRKLLTAVLSSALALEAVGKSAVQKGRQESEKDETSSELLEKLGS
jgi:hypothetical protein